MNSVLVQRVDFSICISDPNNVLSAVHSSQLSFWGFHSDASSEKPTYVGLSDSALLVKVVNYLQKDGINAEIESELRTQIDEYYRAAERMQLAKQLGAAFKDGTVDSREFASFSKEIEECVTRPLRDHQCKAAYHLYSVKNSANFSVPGAGKTAVVISVYEMLRRRGTVNVLFVAGPPSCFAPWRTEYELTLGRRPTWEVVAGGDRYRRQSKYAVSSAASKDMYLTTYQSLLSDKGRVIQFLNQRGLHAFLVIDEAHYIKRLDGSWATAVLGLARYAARRCVLTGTPIPRSYADAFNLFDFLWPDYSPLTSDDKTRICVAQDSGDHATARKILDADIGPMFYRVRKSELGLMPARYHAPMVIPMNKYERLVYEAIANRIRSYAQNDYLKNVAFVRRLQRGRMIRLRQCVSNASLLQSALRDYKEELIVEESVADIVARYELLEIPAKVEHLMALVSRLTGEGEKVVVWTNFIGTLKLIHRSICELGIECKMIYGETPVEKTSIHDAATREQIIAEFKDAESGLQVLLMNPAACAESISLHTASQHAVYYDLSYNLAQYLQSLDRIHRIGGSESKVANYYFLQYANSLDQDIFMNLSEKAERMYSIIEKDYAVYSLDMFEDDGDVEAYDRLFN